MLIVLYSLFFVFEDTVLFQVVIVTMMTKWLKLKIWLTSLYRWTEGLLVS
jgi:hypothetical protein